MYIQNTNNTKSEYIVYNIPDIYQEEIMGFSKTIPLQNMHLRNRNKNN